MYSALIDHSDLFSTILECAHAVRLKFILYTPRIAHFRHFPRNTLVLRKVAVVIVVIIVLYQNMHLKFVLTITLT